MTGYQDFTINRLKQLIRLYGIKHVLVLLMKSFLMLKKVGDSSDEQKTRHSVNINSSVAKILARLIDFTFLFELGFTRFCISPKMTKDSILSRK